MSAIGKTVMDLLEDALDAAITAKTHREQRQRLFRRDQDLSPGRLLAREAHGIAAQRFEYVADLAWSCMRHADPAQLAECWPHDESADDEVDLSACALVEQMAEAYDMQARIPGSDIQRALLRSNQQ